MLQADTIHSRYYIRSCQQQYVELVDHQAADTKNILLRENFYLSHCELIRELKIKDISDLNIQYLEQFSNVDNLIITTGEKQRFPQRQTYKEIMSLGLAIDFMNNDAGARTYNILVNENRKTGLLFLFQSLPQ